MQGMFISPENDKTADERTLISQIITSSQSIEEFIYKATSASYRLRMAKLPEEENEVIAVTFEKYSSYEHEPINAVLFSKKFPRPSGYKRLNLTPDLSADKSGATLSQVWWEARAKRLGIKDDRWNPDNQVAPASSLNEIVMSYLDAPCGIIEIRKDLLHIWAGVKYCLHLKLMVLFNDRLSSSASFEEDIHIPFDKLEKLINKRQAKVSENLVDLRKFKYDGTVEIN